MDTFEIIKIAPTYKVDGQEPDVLDRAEVVYHEMPGRRPIQSRTTTCSSQPESTLSSLRTLSESRSGGLVPDPTARP